jgi:hypothetical protein
MFNWLRKLLDVPIVPATQLTAEQVDLELKRLIVYAFVLIMFGGFFAFVYSVTHVEQPMIGTAPIDKQYLQNIKEIMLMVLSSLGTILAQKGYAAAREAFTVPDIVPPEPEPKKDEPDAA